MLDRFLLVWFLVVALGPVYSHKRVKFFRHWLLSLLWLPAHKSWRKGLQDPFVECFLAWLISTETRQNWWDWSEDQWKCPKSPFSCSLSLWFSSNILILACSPHAPLVASWYMIQCSETLSCIHGKTWAAMATMVEARGERCNFGVKLRSTDRKLRQEERHGLSELPSDANKGWAKVAWEVGEKGERCSIDISMYMLQAKVRWRWQLRLRQEESIWVEVKARGVVQHCC